MDVTVHGSRLEVRRLGTVSYQAALELQKQLVEERKPGRIPDQLLLLEHPPVITLGARNAQRRIERRSRRPEALAQQGVGLFETGRGGDVTYHGPGQLVGYPILELPPDRRDVHRYVRDLEEVLIQSRSRTSASPRRGSRADRHLGGRREARRHRRPHLALGDEPRLRAQRQHRSVPVRIDRSLRNRAIRA